MIAGGNPWGSGVYAAGQAAQIDPRTTPDQLRQILAAQPDRALEVALHPNVDQALRSWLWRTGDDNLRTEIYRHYLFQREQLLSAWSPLPPEAVAYDAQLMMVQQQLQGSGQAAAWEQVYHTVMETQTQARESADPPEMPLAEGQMPEQVPAQPLQGEARFQLVLPDGGVIPVTESAILLGRAPTTDEPNVQIVAIDDPQREVSRAHARLDWQGDVWTVTDLQSANGVFLAAADARTRVPALAPTPVGDSVTLSGYEIWIQQVAAGA